MIAYVIQLRLCPMMRKTEFAKILLLKEDFAQEGVHQ